MKTKLLFASTLFFVYFGYICAQGFSENVDLKRLRLELKDVDSLHCCPEKFYHKVSCLFESSSETLTGSSGLL